MKAIHALLLAALLCWAATGAGTEQAITLGGLNVTVWSSASAHDKPLPVIIFSHGFHGCATQSRFLMEAFANAGYLVFAPNHRDASCNGGSGSWFDRPEAPFHEPQQWTEDTFRDRAEDIRRLRDAIRSDERFRGRADLTRLGLAGHSLGGYTVLGLAGAWPGWRLGRVSAVLALSPYSQAFIVHDTLGRLDAPVMYQGGTRDFGTTPAIQKTKGAYDQSPVPKYLVEFDAAAHFAWTNLGIVAREEIVTYSVAFMDRYVRGVPAPALTREMPGVAELRFAFE